MTTRTRIFAGLFLCIGLVALGYVVFRAETCRRIIAEETSLGFDAKKPNDGSQGLTCYWRIGGGEPTQTTPSLWQIICGARPVEIWLNNLEAEPPVTIERSRTMGEALRFFASLEKINVQGAGEEGLELFMSVGYQPHLTQASSFRTPITDEINSALRGFPRLRDLTISTSEYRARRFPYLPELETIDLQASPIAFAGLARIADSPKLKLLVLDDGELTAGGYQLIQEIKAKHPHLKGLDFDPPKPEKPE